MLSKSESNWSRHLGGKSNLKHKYGSHHSFAQTFWWFPLATWIAHSNSFSWLTRLNLTRLLPTFLACAPAPTFQFLKPTRLFATPEPGTCHVSCQEFILHFDLFQGLSFPSFISQLKCRLLRGLHWHPHLMYSLTLPHLLTVFMVLTLSTQQEFMSLLFHCLAQPIGIWDPTEPSPHLPLTYKTYNGAST